MTETATDRETIEVLHRFRNQTKAAKYLGISRNSMKKRICRIRKKGLMSETTTRTSQVKRYVITAAQNNTQAHPQFLESIHQYCEHFGAKLMVIPVNYENITLTSKNGREEKWWAAGLVPHFVTERQTLNDNLMLMADVSVNATNKHPLSGFETVTGKRSGIFGHGQIEMQMIPTPLSKLPKMLHTTGSVTMPNYSDTKAGRIAEDNHCIGALVVETDGSRFWIRQIRADEDGAFYDLNLKFTPSGIEQAEPALGLVCGDIHWDFICPQVKAATFTASDSIKAVLKPRKLILHDVLDFYSASHHHEKNALLRFHKHHNQKNNVQNELDRLVDGVREITHEEDDVVFVGSNHNEHFGQWLNRCNPNDDPENALVYHEVRLEQLRRAKESREFLDPLEWWFEKHLTDRRFQFIDHDSGMVVGKYDISNHGHIGANGSRGSAKQFTKFGGYYILGHSHTPGIYKNVIQVGTSSVLRLEYNDGPSSWLNSHAIIYPNGLASLIHIIDGRWRA
ncbi:helix-turn-helix domain-containing protein [Marinobacter salarius]|uniref:DNA binding HTH domain-containing protein n=1 Tax=Marinobacter salarius TaxID=1420917 RepID=A0A1W6K989_9GAMM|nr:helix-turn-helix domain-containing protein [Marinobacter salarius]ARM83967.1 hypothetical protein MARSALSMR5_01889 [Marinobacter salarius]